MPFHLGDAEQAAISGGDEDFIGGIQVFGPQHFLFYRNTRRRSNVQQNAACDAFEAPRGKRRRKDAPAARTKNIGSRTLGDFAAFIEEQGFIESEDLLELICFIEATFSIQIRDDELTNANFATLLAISEMVAKKLATMGGRRPRK